MNAEETKNLTIECASISPWWNLDADFRYWDS